MQRAMEDGDDGRVESVRVRMREISGERNTDNVMFFGYARVGQIMQTTSILEVCGCGCGCGCIVSVTCALSEGGVFPQCSRPFDLCG